ncbi:MAG: band 7 protein, partial [Planctomycetes bacterium]|nr:band 7 protein [Planctomycetota bacterium]
MPRFRSHHFAGSLFGAAAVLVAVVVLGGLFFQFYICRIEVPTRHMAVLIKKTGQDLPLNEELAPSVEYKGLQREVLGEGRYYRNPWSWKWIIVPQIEIPEGKLGIRTRLHGEDPPYGEVIAWKPEQKGIVPEVLRPGRY